MKKLFLLAFIGCLVATTAKANYVRWDVTSIAEPTIAESFSYAQLEYFTDTAENSMALKSYDWAGGATAYNANWEQGDVPQAAYISAITAYSDATFIAVAYDADDQRIGVSAESYTADQIATYLMDDTTGGIPSSLATPVDFTFAVPEPTSGLLLLVGASLLVLRRKRS